MYWKTSIAAIVVAGILTGCSSSSDRQWMKINERYSTAEFQRDHAACSKGGALDETCMRNRGWVDVNPSKADKPPDPEPARSGVYTPANQRGGR